MKVELKVGDKVKCVKSENQKIINEIGVIISTPDETDLKNTYLILFDSFEDDFCTIDEITFVANASANETARIKLAKRIVEFIEKYAAISPNFDPWDFDCDISEKFTSPDATEMLVCAEMLLKGQKVICNSSWESCGYHPYTSKEGRLEHDAIILELKNLTI